MEGERWDNVDAPSPSLVGQRVGVYDVVQEIGRGGMATVYVAHDGRHNRSVALKVLDQRISSALGPDRFLREIRIAASLTHPNIVPLHDSGQADGQLYYVMPLVKGESLRARLRRDGPLPIAEALRLAGEIAEALDYAHRHGVVHRDVKPENILLAEGHCFVVDFGIARAIHEAASDRLTATGLVLGTPAYMSPEQASGEVEIDARSDVFSLGVVLFEMLTEVSPFGAPTVGATLARVISAPVPSVREQRADVPVSVDEFLRTALMKDRGSRFQTAGEMAAQLHALANALSLDRAPRRRLTRTLRRRPKLVAAVSLVVLAVAVGALFWRAAILDPSSAFPAAVPSIAVLPFRDETADSANAYFASGIAEELLNALADVPGLRVASRTASFSQSAASSTLRDLGRQLGVTTVLEGTVRRSGPNVRVTARLINAGDGSVIWSSAIDGAGSGVFAVQETIARAIVERMSVRLLAGETTLVRRRTRSADAYDLVLRARYVGRTNSRAGLLEAAQLLHQALALDSSYAETHAQLAVIYQDLAIFRDQSGLPGEVAMTAGEMLRRARIAAQRAVDLDAASSSAHAALGLLLFRYDWNWSGAERELRRALELQPTSGEAHSAYSRFLRSMARFAEARDQLDSARTYGDPGRSWGLSYGRIAFFARDFERAIRETTEDGNAAASRTYEQWLAHAYAGAGNYAKAESLLIRLTPPSTAEHASLAYVYARTGRAREARGLLNSIEGTERADPTYLAGVYAALGDTAAAFTELDRAIVTRDPLVVDMKVFPWLDPLREHPRFKAMMQRLAFPAP